MIDYYTLFWVLIAFMIGVAFDDWLKYMNTMKKCDKCHGNGYMKK